MSSDDFDVIGAIGKVVVEVLIRDEASGAPADISTSDRVVTAIGDRVLRIAREVDGAGDEVPMVAVVVDSLDRVSAYGGASLVLRGVSDELGIEALDYGNIDATELRLGSATVDLELSTVSLWATGSVSGFVAYQSELTVAGGGDVSGVRTVNAGRLFIVPAP